MSTIKDYVKYYKNFLFEEVPFNDVDSLIFTQVVYADFESIVPKEKGKYILFSDAVRLFLKRYDYDNKKYPKFFREVFSLIDDIKDAKRYANIKVYNYVKIVDKEKQFCAITYRFNNNVYIAFEGTDTSVVGWKEDFLLSSTFPVLAQRFAIQYLNETIGLFDGNVYVGGHSKGGNLAMTASMLANVRNKIKIKNVYNFDGPGFRTKEFESNAYKKMCLKLKMYVPEDSTIGLMLLHTNNYKVVKTNTSGFWQHDPFTWEVFGGVFVLGSLTSRSINLEKSNIEFISSLNENEKNEIIEIIFSVFDKLGITDISEFKIPKLNQALNLIKDIKNIKNDIRKKIVALFKIIIKGI